MSVLSDLKMYSRFAWGLRGYLRQRISAEDARVIVRRRLAERENNFLRLMERGVYGRARSPYRRLLALARCELGDLQAMVRARGLEATLEALRAAGVYVTFEEFKGRAPIVRDGQVIAAHSGDFDNPHLSPHYQAETGGTTGAGTRVAFDLDHLAATAVNTVLAYDVHRVLGLPTVMWYPILPASSGLASILLRPLRRATREVVLAGGHEGPRTVSEESTGDRIHRGVRSPLRRPHAVAGARDARRHGGRPLGRPHAAHTWCVLDPHLRQPGLAGRDRRPGARTGSHRHHVSRWCGTAHAGQGTRHDEHRGALRPELLHHGGGGGWDRLPPVAGRQRRALLQGQPRPDPASASGAGDRPPCGRILVHVTAADHAQAPPERRDGRPRRRRAPLLRLPPSRTTGSRSTCATSAASAS